MTRLENQTRDPGETASAVAVKKQRLDNSASVMVANNIARPCAVGQRASVTRLCDKQINVFVKSLF